MNYAALEKTPKVVGTKYQSEQLQVVIGTEVADYFAPIAKELGLDETSERSEGEKKESYPYLWILFPVYLVQSYQR